MRERADYLCCHLIYYGSLLRLYTNINRVVDVVHRGRAQRPGTKARDEGRAQRCMKVGRKVRV